MYTALLAGGQMIKKVVKKSFDPPEGEGLNTFDFESKSRMVRLKVHVELLVWVLQLAKSSPCLFVYVHLRLCAVRSRTR